MHNLRKINRKMPHAAYPWAEEFDHRVKKAITEHDVESLSAPDRWGRSLFAEAHRPSSTMRRFSTCLGSTDERDRVSYHTGDGVRRDLDAHGALRARGYLKRAGTACTGGASHCQVRISQAGE